jgi:LysM repeat protein
MRRKVVGALLVVVLVWTGAAVAQGTSWTGRYKVRAGDSLTVIARHYRVSLNALAAVNRLDWRKPLLIGVVLRVPSSAGSVAAGAAAGRTATAYVVRYGDTLSGIALRFHVTLARLASANRIDPAGLLLSGTRLQIPAGGGSTIDLANVVETNPYVHGSTGYDVSYPNCPVTAPSGYSFSIVGLNWGRPFTANPCFQSEWDAAQRPRSVYINTAYDPVLFRHITPDCAAAGSVQSLGPAEQRAYAVGCSEAVAALTLLGEIVPLAIWLDVEPDNTWSSELRLNAATIRGILERLLTQSPHPLVGVYSNAAFWEGIVGNWTTLGVPEWISASGPDPPGCPAPFAAGPVWLNQSVNGQLDVDTAC